EVSSRRIAVGERTFCQSIVRDISERRGIEEQLRASREYLGTLFAASPVALYTLTLEGVVMLWNPAAERMFGWRAEEVLGQYLPIVPPGKEEETRALRELVARGESSTGVELQRRRKDGSPIPISLSTAPLRGSEGKVTGIIALAADITEQKRAEQALRESENRFRTLSEEFHSLLNALPDSICLLNSDNRIIWSNAAASREMAADGPHLEGTLCHEARLGKEHTCRGCPVQQAFTSGRQEEKTLARPDGTVAEIRAVPLTDGDGRVRSVIEIVRDITAQRRMETELRHMQKMEALGTLAGGVAHDFNNILTTVTGYGSLLRRKLVPEDPLQRYVSHILESAERAAVVTNGLLAYCRKGMVDLHVIDLSVLVRNLDMFLTRIIGEDIQVVVRVPEAPLSISADAAQIEQVIMNLASNARDAMRRGGRLEITAAVAPTHDPVLLSRGYGGRSYALLTVSDTGEGMSDEVRERIFEPFYTTKEVGKGTGLGLSIVYGIVDQHEGFVTVHSDPGEGSTFAVYLPLADAPPERPEQPRDPEVHGGAETVLLVEDDPQIREYLGELLQGEGYRVLQAADGEQGTAMFRRNAEEVDILLLDVVMPGRNGRQVLEEARSVRPSVKALFMSGYTREVINLRGVDAEGLEFIPKPVSGPLLLSRLRDILDGRKG
ncbi:MAG TPA: PAS domain S-box protein, partial [Verrucomicrobiae bacterium]|nr:PAS domain S-box protein [Verrucomicrobiae bacterium]